MVSEYLDRSRPLEELDDLILKHKLAAAKVAEVKFKTDLINAVTVISEISQVASARILADSQVVSAKMTANAEIANARLMVDVDIAISEIVKTSGGDMDPESLSIAEDMIKEVGRIGGKKLSERAKESIAAIKKTAKDATMNLEEISTQSIRDIQQTAEQTASQIETDAEIAVEKIRLSKLGDRTTETAAQEADEAAELIIAAAKAVSSEMKAEVQTSISALQNLAEKTSKTLSEMAAEFETRIIEARDKAVGALKETIEVALRRQDFS